MIVRCQLCNTPLFELTMKEDQCIIIVKGKHHGEWHKTLIRIEELIARLKGELPMTEEKAEGQEVDMGGFICVPEEFRAALMQRWAAELDREVDGELPDDPNRHA